MPAQERVIPNLACIEKHLSGYVPLLRKQHYSHFKTCITGIIEGAGSMAELSRKSGTPERTLQYFFNDGFFNDQVLISQSVKAMNHYTATRSTREALLVLDFTSTFKTGQKFEWGDWLWNEDTDEPDGWGHEQLLALEVHPIKRSRKCLGFRRYYHQQVLVGTEHWRDDFEKKPVCTNRLISQVKPLTQAQEVIVDGEFINPTLVNHCRRLRLDWTGRIRKSLLATYGQDTQPLQQLAQGLITSGKYQFQDVRYRNQHLQAFVLTVKLPSLKGLRVQVAVCKNSQGRLAFIATSIPNRSAVEICRIYGLRWEIEVFIRDTKQNLSLGSYRTRGVAANTRRQALSLVAANLLELVRKTKLEKLTHHSGFTWFKTAVRRLYSTTRMTLGVTRAIIKDLRTGGQDLITALKKLSHLNKAKYYLRHGVNFAGL
jgi:hypothetical protein